jgi:hypothetical protein
MSIGECIKQYEVIGTAIFQDPRRFGLFGLLHDRHHKAPLVDAIQTLTESRTPNQYRTGDTGERFKNFPSPGDLCRTYADQLKIHERTKLTQNPGQYVQKKRDQMGVVRDRTFSGPTK